VKHPRSDRDYTDDIAARLLAMPPKPHEDMKLGRNTREKGADELPRRRPQKSGKEVDQKRERPKARG
jgi:hypothetical protein